MTEPTEEDLLNAVKECLTRDGHLKRFKGELRAAVISVLNRSSGNQMSHKSSHIPEESKLINELIREYLEWTGFRYTEQVLVAEAGHGEKMRRTEMASKLNITEDHETLKIPLLFFIVNDYIKKNEL